MTHPNPQPSGAKLVKHSSFDSTTSSVATIVLESEDLYQYADMQDELTYSPFEIIMGDTSFKINDTMLGIQATYSHAFNEKSVATEATECVKRTQSLDDGCASYHTVDEVADGVKVSYDAVMALKRNYRAKRAKPQKILFQWSGPAYKCEISEKEIALLNHNSGMRYCVTHWAEDLTVLATTMIPYVQKVTVEPPSTIPLKEILRKCAVEDVRLRGFVEDDYEEWPHTKFDYKPMSIYLEEDSIVVERNSYLDTKDVAKVSVGEYRNKDVLDEVIKKVSEQWRNPRRIDFTEVFRMIEYKYRVQLRLQCNKEK